MLRLDDLQFEGLEMYQDTEGYAFTSDSVLLCNFVSFLPNSKVVEFCAGTGVISILLSKKQKPKVIHAFEIQKASADIFNKNVLHNNLQDLIFVHNNKLEDAPQILGKEYADVVVCNPPYLEVNAVDVNLTNKDISTKEHLTNLENVIVSAKNILKFRGKLFLVHRVDRLVDVMCLLRKHSLEPKILNIVYPNEVNEPCVFLVMASKGGKKGLRITKATFASEFNKASYKPADEARKKASNKTTDERE